MPRARGRSHAGVPVSAPFTSVAQATLDDTGAATYVFDLDWQLPTIPDLTAYGHVHTGSIAAVIEPGGADVRAALAAARATGATVSYDPNARPSLMGAPADARRLIEEAIATADVVKLSDEDVEWLCPGEQLDDVIAAWGALGPALLVVTRGGAGATVRVQSTGEVQAVPAPRVDVVDTVGAGDSFMAGLVSGSARRGPARWRAQRERLRGRRFDDVAPAVHRALRTGALTVERAGAHAPRRGRPARDPLTRFERTSRARRTTGRWTPGRGRGTIRAFDRTVRGQAPFCAARRVPSTGGSS